MLISQGKVDTQCRRDGQLLHWLGYRCFPRSNEAAERQEQKARGSSRRSRQVRWCSVPADQGLDSVMRSSGSVRGRAPAGNAFRRILNATERSFLHLYADALSSSNSVLCHIGGKTEVRGAVAPCPNEKPPLLSHGHLRHIWRNRLAKYRKYIFINAVVASMGERGGGTV